MEHGQAGLVPLATTSQVEASLSCAAAAPAAMYSGDQNQLGCKSTESDGAEKDAEAVVLSVEGGKLLATDGDRLSPRALGRKSRPLHRLRSIPSYWWTCLAVFIVLETVAVVGSYYYARSVQQTSISQATEVAETSARALEKLLQDQKAPILFLASLIERTPHWPTFNASFSENARIIYKHYPYYEVEACPYGFIGAMEFPWLNLTGWDEYKFKLDFDYQLDLMNRSRFDWSFNIYSIQQTDIILAGPWYGAGPLASGAFVLRHNIFLPAADAPSWELPNKTIDNNTGIGTCDPSVCNRGNLTWWGWANSVFVFDDIKAGLTPITSHNLLYSLAPSPLQLPGHTYPLIAYSQPLPNNSTRICVNVRGFGDSWYWPLCVDDPSGRNFWPAWFPGLIVGVTALAILISGLLLLVLRSRSNAVALFKQQLLTNKELAIAKEEAESGRRQVEEEKCRMEALMQRQHQLIELFASGQPESRQGDTMRSDTSARDRIEELRHRLARNSNARGASNAGGFDITLLELLGEGSFGKVYRGTWRGTEVAIKTMVLPSYMSGNEKREKMLIMETAISSALAHPNIVQTFTYSIDNLVENEHNPRSLSVTPASDSQPGTLTMGAIEDCLVLGGSQAAGDTVAPAISAAQLQGTSSPLAAGGRSPAGGTVTVTQAAESDLSGGTPESPVLQQQRQQQQQRSRSIHGYEVRLVLEYCDRGCLHDALVQDAYMSTHGLNYSAILDTALDVTRAMVHLHMADVLHGDLKARNVMLKSSGTEGRGVVAKIADFGLAVRIDTSQQTHMSNLFQGTLTHMAPELLLHGRMSKAADVYAFGIMLYELFTASEPFHGVPQALLGHQVIHERKRPAFPFRPPEEFAQLVEECWHPDALMRPSFEAIMPRLEAMRAALGGSTPPLMPYTLAPPASLLRQQADAEAQGAMRIQSNQLYQAGSAGVSGLGSAVLLVSNSGYGMSSFRNSAMGIGLDTVVEEHVDTDGSGQNPSS